MEVVGTAASIIQLAGAGFVLAKTLYALYDHGASGNEQVLELSFYIQSTSLAFNEVGKIFEEEGKAETPLISKNAIIDANAVVARCREIFDKLTQMAEDGKKNAIGLLTFLLKGSRLRVWQTRLDQSKVHLQLMMQIITYARLKVEPREGQRPVATEPDQRRLVGDFIDRRDAMYEENRLAEERAKAEQDAESDPPFPLASLSATDARPGDPTGDSGRILPPSSTPVEGSAPTNGSGHGNIQPLPEQPSGNHPRKTDISYWSALYLVCCPCLARAKTRLHQPALNPASSVGQSTPSALPAHPHTSPVHQNRPHEGISELPATSQPSLAIPANRASELGDAIQLSGRITELPAAFPPSSEIAAEIHLPHDDVRDLKVDRLLREWTTVYDKPSFVVES